MDSPGVVTSSNTNTYPQYDIHISVEGNNTIVLFFSSIYYLVI